MQRMFDSQKEVGVEITDSFFATEAHPRDLKIPLTTRAFIVAPRFQGRTVNVFDTHAIAKQQTVPRPRANLPRLDVLPKRAILVFRLARSRLVPDDCAYAVDVVALRRRHALKKNVYHWTCARRGVIDQASILSRVARLDQSIRNLQHGVLCADPHVQHPVQNEVHTRFAQILQALLIKLHGCVARSLQRHRGRHLFDDVQNDIFVQYSERFLRFPGLVAQQ